MSSTDAWCVGGGVKFGMEGGKREFFFFRGAGGGGEEG